MAISLEGKTAIVTCGAQDLGRTIAAKMAAAGAQVMLADCCDGAARNEDLPDDGPGECKRFGYKVQDKLGTANLIAATVDRYGGIDILVNAAQFTGTPSTFLEMDPTAFERAFQETVQAPFLLSQAVARRMVEARSTDDDQSAGVIINVGSIAARRTTPELIALSVSSAALDQLTKSMAVSLAEQGIRVNGVAIGSVLTGHLKAAIRENEDLRDDVVRVTPMGRLADDEEAAETVLFLASDHASYITGQVVAVDGGRTLLDPLAAPVR